MHHIMTRSASPYPTEAQEQKTVIAYFAHTWIGNHLIHIPNGGSRSSDDEGANLKAMGVKAGVSDLFLPYPIEKAAPGNTAIPSDIHDCGLWVELKRNLKYYASQAAAYKAVTQLQRDWLVSMEEQGYRAEVAYGADHAIKIIEAYTGTSPM